MKVRVHGSERRTHSLVWKVAKSSPVKTIICAPGNPGSARYAGLFDVSAEDLGGK